PGPAPSKDPPCPLPFRPNHATVHILCAAAVINCTHRYRNSGHIHQNPGSVTSMNRSPSTQPTVIKTDQQWRTELEPRAYAVLRQAATEPPFTGEYTDTVEAG